MLPKSYCRHPQLAGGWACDIAISPGWNPGLSAGHIRIQQRDYVVGKRKQSLLRGLERLVFRDGCGHTNQRAVRPMHANRVADQVKLGSILACDRAVMGPIPVKYQLPLLRLRDDVAIRDEGGVSANING